MPRAHRIYRSFRCRYECRTALIEVPGTGMEVLQSPQKFRVRYGSRTELTKVPIMATNVVRTRTPGIVARAYRTYRSFGYGYECRTGLAEIPGTGTYGCLTEQTTYRGCGYGHYPGKCRGYASVRMYMYPTKHKPFLVVSKSLRGTTQPLVEEQFLK